MADANQANPVAVVWTVWWPSIFSFFLFPDFFYALFNRFIKFAGSPDRIESLLQPCGFCSADSISWTARSDRATAMFTTGFTRQVHRLL
jgi:hypothetical protein